jgi:putative ATPase
VAAYHCRVPARRPAGRAPDPLFAPPPELTPLAARMRPLKIDEVVGQAHLLGPGAPLRRLVESGRLPSMLLWGPPGSGKTTIGRLLAEAVGARFEALNTTMDGVAALRDVVAEARSEAAFRGSTTVVLLDEVHRYSKAQQDALLPHVEAGTIVLVGATTESPFGGGITRPLLSRLRVFRLEALGDAELREIARRALADAEHGLGGQVELDEVALRQLIGYASGDARRLLGILETAASLASVEGRTALDPADVARAAQSATLDYDRSGVISAFIKSIRGGDADAALYWLATALEAGDDPRYLARRLVVSASEDVGNAEPRGLSLALAALEAVEKIGAETNDEGVYALAQASVFLAQAPKDPSAGRGFFAAREAVRSEGTRPVPSHLRPAAKTYRNPHDDPVGAAAQRYLPRGMEGRRFLRRQEDRASRAGADQGSDDEAVNGPAAG